MDFDDFAARAREIAAAMPPEFMAGIDSVEVHREAKKDSVLPDVLLLGECETSPLSDPTGQEPFRSIVHLYYGSFADFARNDRSFDVEHELRETIEHEVQHHIEDRAGAKDLRDEDDLFAAHARFLAGMDVPPGWYRFGVPVGDRLWSVDRDLFLELPLRRKEWEALRGKSLTLHVMDEPLDFEVPADAAPDEILTIQEAGLFEPDADSGDEGDDDEDVPGTYGDLHVVPLVR
jgi:hypothetical protein